MREIKKILKQINHLILVQWKDGSTIWEDIDLIWDFIPPKYRPTFYWDQRCKDHWNTPEMGDQLDGPPPRRRNCGPCNRHAPSKFFTLN